MTEQKMLGATSAFQMLIQATAEIADNRCQVEESGFISKKTSNRNAVAILMAAQICGDGWDLVYSPQVCYQLLATYCLEDMSCQFSHAFILFANHHHGLVVSEDEVTNSCIELLYDIPAFAKEGLKRGYKRRWCTFKEPYKSQWIDVFDNDKMLVEQ